MRSYDISKYVNNKKPSSLEVVWALLDFIFFLLCVCSGRAFQRSCLSKSSGLNENASQHVHSTGCLLMCSSLESSEEPKNFNREGM